MNRNDYTELLKSVPVHTLLWASFIVGWRGKDLNVLSLATQPFIILCAFAIGCMASAWFKDIPRTLIALVAQMLGVFGAILVVILLTATLPVSIPLLVWMKRKVAFAKVEPCVPCIPGVDGSCPHPEACRPGGCLHSIDGDVSPLDLSDVFGKAPDNRMN